MSFVLAEERYKRRANDKPREISYIDSKQIRRVSLMEKSRKIFNFRVIYLSIYALCIYVSLHLIVLRYSVNFRNS